MLWGIWEKKIIVERVRPGATEVTGHINFNHRISPGSKAESYFSTSQEHIYDSWHIPFHYSYKIIIARLSILPILDLGFYSNTSTLFQLYPCILDLWGQTRFIHSRKIVRLSGATQNRTERYSWTWIYVT